jgi:hypothetical protein
MIVRNTPDEMGSDSGRFVLETEERRQIVDGTKEEASIAIWNAILASKHE